MFGLRDVFILYGIVLFSGIIKYFSCEVTIKGVEERLINETTNQNSEEIVELTDEQRDILYFQTFCGSCSKSQCTGSRLNEEVEKINTGCYCDDVCLVHMDCCYDYEFNCKPDFIFNKQPNKYDYTKYISMRSNSYRFVCYQTHERQFPMKMFSYCVPRYDFNFETLLAYTTLPVIYGDLVLLNYNTFLCESRNQNWRIKDLKVPTMDFICKYYTDTLYNIFLNEDIENVIEFLFKNCRKIFDKNHEYHSVLTSQRNTCSNLISTCTIDDEHAEDLCPLYSDHVVLDGFVYQNIHCLKCNFANLTGINYLSCSSLSMHVDLSHDITDTYTLRYDYNDAKNHTLLWKGEPWCKLHDMDVGVCLDRVCQRGETLLRNVRYDADTNVSTNLCVGFQEEGQIAINLSNLYDTTEMIVVWYRHADNKSMDRSELQKHLTNVLLGRLLTSANADHLLYKIELGHYCNLYMDVVDVEIGENDFCFRFESRVMEKITRNKKLRENLVIIGLTLNGIIATNWSDSEGESNRESAGEGWIPGLNAVSSESGVLAIFIDEKTKYGTMCKSGRLSIERNDFSFIGYEDTGYRILVNHDQMLYDEGVLPVNFGLLAPFRYEPNTSGGEVFGGNEFRNTMICEHQFSRCKSLRMVPAGLYWNRTDTGVVELPNYLFIEATLTYELPNKSLLFCEKYVQEKKRKENIFADPDQKSTIGNINSAICINLNKLCLLIHIFSIFYYIFI